MLLPGLLSFLPRGLQALHEEMTAVTPPPRVTPRVPSLQAACEWLLPLPL